MPSNEVVKPSKQSQVVEGINKVLSFPRNKKDYFLRLTETEIIKYLKGIRDYIIDIEGKLAKAIKDPNSKEILSKEQIKQDNFRKIVEKQLLNSVNAQDMEIYLQIEVLNGLLNTTDKEL